MSLALRLIPTLRN